MQIRRFIWLFPQFLKYENNWDYIISIPKIPPKNESMQILRHIINWNRGNIVEYIPREYKNIILDIFEKQIDKCEMQGCEYIEVVKNEYKEVINILKEKM
ncbi:MAG: hypothetical protein LBH44_12440, partial [Treponema sp.]|jgi:hypothetical protein|nr:hypothetical protein [Treponema sp.]